jgi:hypothetical protein
MGGVKGSFGIDLNDEVVRGSIILQDGKMMWPPPPISHPPPAAKKATAIVKPPEVSPFNNALQEAGLTAGTFNTICNSCFKSFLFLGTKMTNIIEANEKYFNSVPGLELAACQWPNCRPNVTDGRQKYTDGRP